MAAFTLKIEGKQWRVGIETDFPFRFNRRHDPVKRGGYSMRAVNLDGICLGEERCIVLGKHLGPRRLREIFLHELMHACFPFGRKAPKGEEKFVTYLAPRLSRALSALCEVAE